MVETVKITKRIVDAAEPRASRYTLFDSDVAGFGLRIYPSGAKSWVFEYRPGAGGRGVDKKRVTIGKAIDMTPERARKVADTYRAKVRLGQDPQGDKTSEREAATVKDIADAFLEDHVKGKLSEGSAVFYEDIIERIIVPAIGKTKAKDLDSSEVAKFHRQWKATPYQANRILATISSIYNFAGSPEQKLVPQGTNPATGIKKYPEVKRGLLLNPEQLDRLGNTLRLAETAGLPWKVKVEGPTRKHLATPGNRVTRFDPHVIAAIRLLLFTGARLREILRLEWKDILFEEGLLILRKHKTSGRTGTKSIVLNAPALEILEALPRVGRYVIAGATAGKEDEVPRSDLKKPWTAIQQHAGLEGVRIHDLRHNYASTGMTGGMGLLLVGKLLGHTQAQTTQRYEHLDVDPLRIAAERIGKQLAAATDGKPAAKVSSLEDRKREAKG
jgi:integrase